MTTGYRAYVNRIKTPDRMVARIAIDLMRYHKDIRNITGGSYNVNNFYPPPVPGTPPSSDLCDVTVAYQLLITSNDTGGNLEPASYYDDAGNLIVVPDAILTTLSECDLPFDFLDRLRYTRVVIGDGNECFLIHDENHIAEAMTWVNDGFSWLPEVRDSIIIPVMDEITGLQIPDKLMACTLEPTTLPGFFNGFRIKPLSWSLEAEVEILQISISEGSAGS